MKKLYWILIIIVISVALAEGYALYHIPKTVKIEGLLSAEYADEIQPGTIFRVSLESRETGQNKFAILAASESLTFYQYPQKFTLPVLKKSLSDIGIYQLRVHVLNNEQLLYVNKGLLPLTFSDLVKPINIEMQSPPKQREKIIIAEVVAITPTPDVIEMIKVAPVKLDINKLLDGKVWLLNTQQANNAYLVFDLKKQRVMGNGGCNDFQGGYQLDQSVLIFNQFISTSKQCKGAMEVETQLLTSMAKVKQWTVQRGGAQLSFYDENKQLLLDFKAKYSDAPPYKAGSLFRQSAYSNNR